MSGYDDKAATEVEIMRTNQHGNDKQADHFVESGRKRGWGGYLTKFYTGRFRPHPQVQSSYPLT